jgi:hypothetical protein
MLGLLDAPDIQAIVFLPRKLKEPDQPPRNCSPVFKILVAVHDDIAVVERLGPAAKAGNKGFRIADRIESIKNRER